MNGLFSEGLSKSFGGVRVVDDIGFSLKCGETLGLIGTNGAGKSTLVNILTGLIRPDRGVASFNGRDLLKLSRHRFKGAGIARTFQTPRLFCSLTVEENACVAGGEYQPLLRQLGLWEKRHISASALAYADMRRLELVRALSTSPSLLFLDELSAGMITEEAQELSRWLSAWQKTHRLTVVMIEHNLDVVRENSTRVIALDSGRVLSEGSPEKVLSDKTVRARLLGGET